MRTFDILNVIYQTRGRMLHQDIQTPRSGLKKEGPFGIVLAAYCCRIFVPASLVFITLHFS